MFAQLITDFIWLLNIHIQNFSGVLLLEGPSGHGSLVTKYQLSMKHRKMFLLKHPWKLPKLFGYFFRTNVYFSKDL